MARNRDRGGPEINSSSMADIAFLLLIFFLVTTTIANDKGISLLLPPKPDDMEEIDVKIPERNIFAILINSADQLLVEGKPMEDPMLIREMVKEHVMNNGNNPNLSDSPLKAIVSIKADRGTSYSIFITVLDQAQGAYYDMYADRVGVTNERWREIASDHTDPADRELYNRGRLDFPMQLSIAEPTKSGN